MQAHNASITFAIVAGEASGDLLGAELIKSLKQYYPNAVFTGIGGPKMINEGFKSLFPMERLSVMGIIEVLSRIFELVRIRKSLFQEFTTNRPIAFIGIDAPDFNIGLELKLKQQGITTIHYVSPSIWAWRQSRIFKIKKAVDHMLAFLPFEETFYNQHGVSSTFTGHPLADKIPLDNDTSSSKKKLGYSANTVLIGLLPGSRAQEVKRLAPLFIQTARLIKNTHPEFKFIIPCVNELRLKELTPLLIKYSMQDIQLTLGNSHEVMAASDALLLASGTATLEGLLHKKPMVVSYKLSWFTWKIAKFLVKSPWCSLPNILANQTLVPEILQNDATPKRLAEEILNLLHNSEEQRKLKTIFHEQHQILKREANKRAAAAVVKTIKTAQGNN